MRFKLLILSGLLIIQTYAQESNSFNVAHKLNINPNQTEKNYIEYNISEQFFNSQKQKLVSAFIKQLKKQEATVSYKIPENANNLAFNEHSNFKTNNGEYIVDRAVGSVKLKENNIYIDEKKAINLEENYIKQLQNIQFFESWDFDPENGSFIKTVHQLGIQFDSNIVVGFKTKPFKQNVFETNSKEKYALSSNNILIDKISYYVHLTNNNKDTQNKGKLFNPESSSYNNNLSISKRSDLYINILEYVKKEVAINNNSIAYKDGKKLKYEDIINEFSKTETVIIYDDWDGGEQEKEFIIDDYLSDISGLHFNETWYLDTTNFAIKKVVNSISLVKKQYDEEFYDYERYYYIKYFDIQLKNPVKKSVSPFYSNAGIQLSENLYSLDSCIYSTDGTKLTNEKFAEIEKQFIANLLVVGKITGKEKVEIVNEWGEIEFILVDKISYGLINKKGEKILPCVYDEIAFYYGAGYAGKFTRVNGEETYLYNFITSEGIIDTTIRYDVIRFVDSDKIEVKRNDEWYFMDLKGKRIVE